MQGGNVNVPTPVGFLHHYRVCEFGGDSCVHSANQVDTTVPDKYADDLKANMRKVISKLNSKCNLDTDLKSCRPNT